MDLTKRIPFTAFRTALSFLWVAIFAAVMVRYFMMIEASIEEANLNIRLISMRQMMDYQNILFAAKPDHCALLDSPRVFLLSGPLNLWHYDTKTHQLSYRVQSKGYFKSEPPQTITIQLHCNKNGVYFNVAPYQWCQDKSIFGCQKW